MANVIEILIKATDQTSGVVSGISSKLGGALGGALRLGALGAAAGLGTMTGFLGLAVKEAMEAQNTQAELNAVLKSTGGAAGWTADMANTLAEKLSRVTTFSDDAIVEGESMLLTFTKIGKDVFPAATEATLNMAQKFGSVEQAAMQIGKALNDPIAGVSALRRVGVALTDQQEAQIKQFMAVGNVAAAQKLILGELNTEFGGLAQAAGTTLAGKLTILRNRFLNIAEGVGMKLIPYISKGLDILVAFADFGAEQLGRVVEAVSPVVNAIADVVYWLGEAFKAGSAEGGLFGGVLGSLQALFYVYQDGKTTFFSNILESFGVAQDTAQAFGLTIVSVFERVASFVTGTLVPAWTRFTTWITNDLAPAVLSIVVGSVLPAFQRFIDFLAQAWAIVGPALKQVSDWFVATALPAVMTYISNTAIPGLGRFIDRGVELWTTVSPYLLQFLDWFVTTGMPAAIAFVEDTAIPGIERFTQIVAGIWTGIEPTLAQIYDWFVTTALPAAYSFLVDSAIPAVQDFTDTVTAVWTTIQPGLASVYDWFVTTALPAVRSFLLDSLIPAVNDTITVLKNIWDVAGPKLQSFYNFVSGSIGTLKTSVIDPIVNAFNDMINIINDVAGALSTIGDAVPDWLIPGSPTPFELGVRGITRAMQELQGANLFGGSMALAATPAGGMTGGGPITNTFYITVPVTAETLSAYPQAREYARAVGDSLKDELASRERWRGGGVVR